MIFDEATSHVDEATDAVVSTAIQKGFVDEPNRCTTLSIAHRLQTVWSCELFLVFDAGELVQSGSWDALMNMNMKMNGSAGMGAKVTNIFRAMATASSDMASS